MNILVLADHNNQSLNQATRCVITAAQKLGGDIDVLVAGFECTLVGQEATKISGVRQVFIADDSELEHGLAEPTTTLVISLATTYNYIIGSHSTYGKNILPRVAALLNTQMISDIVEVVSQDTFKRPVYAGSAIQTVKSLDKKRVLSIRATAFEPTTEKANNVPVEAISFTNTEKCSRHVADEFAASERPELSSSNIVISGGRGLGSKENFTLLEELADKLGAALGASRAAVDAGYVPNDMQVGQTGKVVAPDLYIAVGISGAIQHLAGMKESKVIVAINKDPDAPIFQTCDYGWVTNLFDAIPELMNELS
ncbi:MAG: FAD-binding protein [Gammaproteobacteria bacterium]|nr:FAD-binding protein [Gammaproteobacteria bacterium]